MATNGTPQPTAAPAQPENLTPEQIAERIAAQVAPQQQPEPLERDFTVQLDTGQVYRGKTKDELIQELKKAQEHSSRRIHELSKQPATPQQAQQAVQNPTFDQQKYYQMLAENPVGANSYLLQFTPEAQQLREQMEQISQFNTVMQEQAAVNQFKAETADFPVDSDTANKFEDVWKQYNLPITTANLKLVHAYCLRENVYKPYQAQPQSPLVPQQQPLPNLSSPGFGNPTQQIDPNSMTADQLKQVIQALNNQK